MKYLNWLDTIAVWYLKNHSGIKFYTLADIQPAINDAKENEAARLKLIHDAEKEDIEKRHQLEKAILTAESSAEKSRMDAEMSLMLNKVKNAQNAYYTVMQKTKVVDGVVSDTTTQMIHMRDAIAQITGCMEGIQARAGRFIQDLNKSDADTRDMLSLPAKDN